MRIVTSQYCCTPMLWFHTTPAYQRASCNMDEGNTCFSLGFSYYRRCIAGGGFAQFSIRRLEDLSSLFLCNLSEREWMVCGTPVTPHSEVLSAVAGTVHNQILISVGRDRSLVQLMSFIWVRLSSQKEESVIVPQLHLIFAIAVTRCVLVYFWCMICTRKMFPGQ